jgi:hypothetical protein
MLPTTPRFSCGRLSFMSVLTDVREPTDERVMAAEEKLESLAAVMEAEYDDPLERLIGNRSNGVEKMMPL